MSERVNPVADDLCLRYPLLWAMSERYDFEERLRGCTDPLLAEVNEAMHELWLARTNLVREHV